VLEVQQLTTKEGDLPMRHYRKWHYQRRWERKPLVRWHREPRHHKHGTLKGMLDTAIGAIGVLSMVVLALVSRRK
jgi:hypothetical protein